MYASSLVDTNAKSPLRNTIVLVALYSVICLPHSRVSDIVIPRYLVDKSVKTPVDEVSIQVVFDCPEGAVTLFE